MDKNFPTTLQEAILYFSNYENCHMFMVGLRWPDGKVKCPRCGSERVTYLEKAHLWKCYEKHERPKFSLKIGTIFEDSPVSIDKWLAAVWLVVNCKNGISSYEIGRALGVTQKTGWFMDHRIRFALHQGSFNTKLGGAGEEVEVDETYIGGLARNMHADVKARKIHGRGGVDKVAVFGLLERNTEKGKSRVRAKVIPNVQERTLQAEIKAHVEEWSLVYSDEHGAYRSLGVKENFFHDFVNHAERYVKDNVYTNGIENFWALLKRSIKGTYVSVEPFHMFRYLDEQSFRFNERFGDDADRFMSAMTGITQKRLTYKTLTGKQEEQSQASIDG